MEYKTTGKIIKGVGGLYEIKIAEKDRSIFDSNIVTCRARGVFRHNNITPLVGDNVELLCTEGTRAATDVSIHKILERKNSLIRPPLANLDYLFILAAVRSPNPSEETLDKLISIAEFNKIEPIIVIGKIDLDEQKAAYLGNIYRLAGYKVFEISCLDESKSASVEKLKNFIVNLPPDSVSAFAGLSGVGKSTLINRIFPSLLLATSEISKKIERGRHTTRHVELYRVTDSPDSPYIADTPGFSMLDFEHFDFFSKDDLPYTMREFEQYIGKCKYTKCTHTKEDGCAVLEGLAAGKIAPSRHKSFVAMYEILKNKHDWDKKPQIGYDKRSR